MATSTTPELGIPYPTPGTGEPADGPTQMKAAFEHIDTALGGTTEVAKGGTGAATAAGARTNLGLGTAATKASTEFASSTSGGREKKKAFTALTGTVTLDLAQASIHYNAADLTGNITLALANVPAVADEATLVTVVIKQNGTVRTVAMPAGVTWVPSPPTQAANKTSVINLMSLDGGTTWTATGVV